MRKELGVLLAAGGALLALLLKKGVRVRQARVKRRAIVVGPKMNVCGVLLKPENVKLRKDEHLHWLIVNVSDYGDACDRMVKVSVTCWKPYNPLIAHGPGGFSRRVQAGHLALLPAIVDPNAEFRSYSYEIHIDGKAAVDPMVDIVP
jgi:hypothetical protein